MWFNFFIVSEVIPTELEFWSSCSSHPLVIKINDIAVGAIVYNQRNNTTFAFFKFLWEFQYVSNRRTTETIQALVIITNYTDIFTFTCKEKYNLFLNEI